MTPWNKNQQLPQPEMIDRYKIHSKNLYITSDTRNDGPKKRDRVTEKMLKRFNKTLKEVKFNKGIIRSRIDINNPSDEWEVGLFGSAIML